MLPIMSVKSYLNIAQEFYLMVESIEKFEVP
jgi:hypothetical protein